MDKVRAEILDLGLPRTTAARIFIDAPAEQIFDLIADPRAHSLFDGSGTLQGSISGPERLYLGAKFAMAMKIRVPYRISNKVVAFEEGRKISWCHLMKWTWSYELRDLGNGRTEVTETFDARNIPRFADKWLVATGSLERNPKWMAKSLVRLKAICES
jgi:uncharacterized protein YndB with AHSA1/START domain|uniref:SRPBCC family protein n=1 Tax=Candidatus Planktophila sp. TaxID=2175601 RepID=UPI00404A55BE